jgi:sortase A
MKVAKPIAVVLAVAGTGVLAWVLVTLTWGEPFTAVSQARAQAALRGELETETKAHPERLPGAPAVVPERPRTGHAFGRLVIPRLDLSTVAVEGTDSGDLARGPGHYPATSMPGSGGVVAIAGHRTTYGHPFRHIDDLRPGDRITLEMPYGTYEYVAYARRIVDDRNWSILRPRTFEKLVLTACHPLYSADQRYVVFARLQAA